MKTREELLDVLIGTIITGIEWGDIIKETAPSLMATIYDILEITTQPFTFEEYKKISFEYTVQCILEDKNTPEEVKQMVKDTLTLEEQLIEMYKKLTGTEDKNDIWTDAIDGLNNDTTK